MDIEKKIRAFIKEADIYRSQGLFDEAKEKLDKTVLLINKNATVIEGSKESLLELIAAQQAVLKKDIEKVDKALRAPEMSNAFQEVVMDKFVFSGDDDKAVLEGAIALVQFGQFKRALEELLPIVENEALRFLATKNILRCYLALNSQEDAVEHYNKLRSKHAFSEDELTQLDAFLKQSIGIKNGDGEGSAGRCGKNSTDKKTAEESFRKMDIPDIHSVEIKFIKDSREAIVVDFKVRSQSADIISFVVPSNEMDMLDAFEEGNLLSDIRYYSRDCLILGKGKISSSSRSDTTAGVEGDCRVDIKII
jgi:tetratricopeptide (TPR) repeat protein